LISYLSYACFFFPFQFFVSWPADTRVHNNGGRWNGLFWEEEDFFIISLLFSSLFCYFVLCYVLYLFA
jgi:hypothetical protein